MVDQIEVENEQGVVKQDIFMEKKMLKGVNSSGQTTVNSIRGSL